ncbi:hypothetical protein [Butyrivibrio sp.]|jgi:hypothetical protein|uniref:hypothetical protein n=1 Tax=Butyrivibrio sp. TaxID=28121 RepID=UPI0025C0BC2B|nr:hypothetical protein [Butyrivibrio sp.]MBE5839572.1 hypothetical protein [Butyrivibrio sp.]
MILTIVLCFTVAIAGGYTCHKMYGKPIVIKYRYLRFSWISPLLLSFVSLMLMAALEGIVVYRYVRVANKSGAWLYALSKFVENGFLIPGICVIASWIFNYASKENNLQYLKHYSNLVSKVCFSVAVVAGCIFFFATVYPYIGTGDDEVDFIMNRIFMWFIAVFGTWFSFGFGCNKQIDEKNDGNLCGTKMNKKELLKFWMPIAFSLLILITILAISYYGILNQYLLPICLISLSFVCGGMIVFMTNSYPSQNKSEKIYRKAVEDYKNGVKKKYNYGRISYTFLNENTLEIGYKKVVYKGHEHDEDFEELFNVTRIEGEDYSRIHEELKRLDGDQRAYISQAFQACLDEFKKTGEASD